MSRPCKESCLQGLFIYVRENENMTIKEIEEASGMQRANIRYYEEEGFLNPEREKNGYRNYTEEDAAGREVTVEDFTGLTLKEAEKQGLKLLSIIPSPITGGDGNVEYLAYFQVN